MKNNELSREQINLIKLYNGFPVKYGVMRYEITSNSGVSFNKINQIGLIGYVVSMCYVLSENKEYRKDGSVNKYSKVIFTWNNENNFLCGDKTPYVFDNYEECKNMVDKLNNNLYKEKEKYNFNNQYKTFLENFKKNIQIITKEAEEHLQKEKTFFFNWHNVEEKSL